MTSKVQKTADFWATSYGILYGAVVAIAYLFVKVRGHDGGLALFAAASVSAFLIHLALFPKNTFQGLWDRQMLIRGLLYGGTQVLIFKAQASGNTSAALVASTLGAVFGVILGRLILGERIHGVAMISVFLCFSAVCVYAPLLLHSYWGMLGGLIQGTGFVLSRSLMVQKKSIPQSISTGFFAASVVSVFALLASGSVISALHVGMDNLLITVVIAIVVQYAFFQLYRIMDAQRASLLTLSRIPWAMSLEHALLGSEIGPSQLLSSSLITLGSAILLLDSNLQLKRTTLKT
jgi:drug/metabolite transporter (DMT)-like permease